MLGGQQPDSWQRVNRVPTQNTDLYSRSIITQAHINKCMIYIAIIILFHVQYYYQILTTCQGINTLTLLHTIITVTIIYTNIASIMSNEEEFGDQRISQPEEDDIEIKEEKEVEEIDISDGAENEIAHINTNTQSRDPSITIPVNISPSPIRTQNNNWSTPTAAMGLLAIDKPQIPKTRISMLYQLQERR